MRKRHAAPAPVAVLPTEPTLRLVWVNPRSERSFRIEHTVRQAFRDLVDE